MKTDVVIVTYGNLPALKATIENFQNNFSEDEYRLIVVNNDMEDNATIDYLHKQKGIEIINQENVGCAEGYNLGFLNVKSKWWVRCDDDMLIPKDYFKKVYAALDEFNKDGKVSIVGTRTLDKGKYPFFTCRFMDTDLTCYTPSFDRQRKRFFCNGLVGVQLINSEIFNEIGYDPIYFPSQWEDHDLCTNMCYHGFKCLYLGDVECIHNMEKSNAGSNSMCGDYYKLKWALKFRKSGGLYERTF